MNGASPEIATVLYWKGRKIIVLVKWPTNSRAADFSGDYYRVNIYEYSRMSSKARIKKDKAMMRHFLPGKDGLGKNGREIHYQFKDATSILKKLRAMYLNDQ